MNATIEGKTCTKDFRIKNLNKSQQSDVHQSYISNNENEKICLAIIDDFQSHFIEQHFELKDSSYIAVYNEYNIPKCVCTTLKPELVPNPSLYELNGCKDFVSEYMEFEPLKDPCKPPVHLPSPTQTLTWGVGDCFDLSIVLASLLIGAGYDAYVVYGIAPKWICTRDRSLTLYCSTDSHHENNLSLETGLDSPEDAIENMYNTTGSPNHDVDKSYINDNRKHGHDEDELIGKRVHCWVMVKAGLRSPTGTTDVFIEPSTGAKFLCNDSHPYMKIFALWNTQNYWIKKVPDDVYSDFELSSNEQWISVFYNKNVNSKPASEIDSRKPFDPPFSWVGPLNILHSCNSFCYPPNGQRVVLRHKLKIESFSEGMHKQALLKRITKFNDEKLIDAYSGEERFGKMRTDYLLRRIKLYKVQSFHEDYSLKHPTSLRKWIEQCGKRRILHFSDRGRSDGLIRHDECFGVSIVQTYTGRRDGLYERTCTVKPFNGSKEKRNGSFILSSTDGTQNLIVVKIVEKFMTQIKGNEQGIASKCFDLEEKCLATEYLRSDEGVERTVVIKSKKRSLNSHSAQDNHDVMNAEKATIAALRLVMQEMTDLVRMRRREEDVFRTDYLRKEDHTSVSRSTIDQNETKAQKKKKRPQHLNYLAPFLLHVKDEDNITREEAIEIKNACLSTCKERLLQRADIMQHRLNEESSKLTRIQEDYQVNPDRNDVTKHEFIRSSSELTFRIKILEKRLHDHEENSVEKYKTLEAKLLQDLNLVQNNEE